MTKTVTRRGIYSTDSTLTMRLSQGQKVKMLILMSALIASEVVVWSGGGNITAEVVPISIKPCDGNSLRFGRLRGSGGEVNRRPGFYVADRGWVVSVSSFVPKPIVQFYKAGLYMNGYELCWPVG